MTNNKTRRTEAPSSVSNICKPHSYDYLLYFFPSICLAIIIGHILHTDFNEHNATPDHAHVQRYYGQIPQMLVDNDFHSTVCQSTTKCTAAQQCGRFISDFMVDQNESKKLLDTAKSLFDNVQRPESGFSRRALNTVQDQPNDDMADLYRSLEARLRNKIVSYFAVENTHLKTSSQSVYYTRLTPSVDRQQVDQKSPYAFTATVHLSSNSVDLIGGNLVFNSSNTLTIFEQKAGRVVLYTSGAENSCYLERVQSNAAYMFTIEFECNGNS